VDFQAGDLLFGFTDGVIEASNREGEEFGDERLAQLLAGSADTSAELLCARVVAELAAFSGRDTFEDDVCFVAIQSTGTTCVVQPVSYEI